MKIYGHFLSTPSNHVRLTASALGLAADYEHVDLMTGAHRSADFLRINPFGKVPALEDDGFTLAESSAICRYLAGKAGGGMYPAGDARARAIIDQWVDFAAHHIRANVGKVLFNKVFAPMTGRTPDEKAMADGRETLDANLPAVESQLARSSFLVGDALTIADTAMIAALEPAEMIGHDLTRYPNIRRWREAIVKEDWYRSVHAHYGAELTSS